MLVAPKGDPSDEVIRTTFIRGGHLNDEQTQFAMAMASARHLRSLYLKKIHDDESIYKRLVSSLYERELTARHQRFEPVYRQVMEALVLDRALQASSAFGVSGEAKRFVVNVGPVKIVVTEDETTVEFANPKATEISFLQPIRSAEPAVTESEETPAKGMRSRVLH